MIKRLSNAEVVQQLKEALAAMEIKGDNRFSIRAYQNVISSIDSLTSSVYDLWENNRLDDIAGIGPGLKMHLDELFTYGRVKEWMKKKEGLPDGMFALLVIRGVGAKTAYKLAEAFKVKKREDAIERIKQAAMSKKIRLLPGFGEKSEKEILDSINEVKKSKQEKPRLLLSRAEEVASRVVEYLLLSEHVIGAIPLGSLRRRKSTVGDLDIAVSSNEPEKVIDHFVKFSEVKNIETQGENMSTVILTNDLQVDILVCAPEAIGSLLQHFTGSKLHNVNLRKLAMEQGKSLSQYGIKVKDQLNLFSNEELFYKDLGLQYIPPEIREGMEEIELAKKNKLPELIDVPDIKGDLHTHTIDSDGVNSLSEMVEKAAQLKYEYIGITDHAPSVINRGRYEVLGLIEKKRLQIEDINSKQNDVVILFGYEVNILKDSTLGLPDDLLEKLDFVIASIHTSFDQSREEITERMLSAIKNPYVDIIGHPTGRLINERPACDIDWDKIFKAVKKYNKILEINSQPNRLDLPDHLVKDAVKMGIPLIINTDAHSTDGLEYIKYGIDVARRGWCEKGNVINTMSFSDLSKYLRQSIASK